MPAFLLAEEASVSPGLMEDIVGLLDTDDDGIVSAAEVRRLMAPKQRIN